MQQQSMTETAQRHVCPEPYPVTKSFLITVQAITGTHTMIWWKYGWCHTLEKTTLSHFSSNKMVQCPKFYQCCRISQLAFSKYPDWGFSMLFPQL